MTMTTAAAMAALDDLPDLVGHILEPVASYLEWVLVDEPNGRAATELRRLLSAI